MGLKTFLVLACLTALLAVNAQNYQPVSEFNLTELLDTTWYELLYADTSPATLSGCTRAQWIQTGEESLTYKLGQFNPGIDGTFIVEGNNLTMDSQSQGLFSIDGAPSGSYVFILDFDPDYEWVIWANNYTFGGFISVLSKTPQNVEAINRVLELATQYNQTSDHLALQTTKCSYNTLLGLLGEATVFKE